MANFVGAEDGARPSRRMGRAARGRRGRPAARDLPVDGDARRELDRGADMLGIGHRSVRHVPVDDDYRDARRRSCERAIARDRDAGRRPFAVVATAGTVATGAIDASTEIADICADEGLWFHVDAAYGGRRCSPTTFARRSPGIERADSIAFDPHKWLYTPLAGGCLLVRDMAASAESFDVDAAYIVQDKEYTQHGHRPRPARAAVLAELLGAEGVGVAARARSATPTRAASRTTRRSLATSARVAERARRLRADGAGRLSISLLPLRAPEPARGSTAREEYLDRPEPSADDRDPARRPRLHLQRDPRASGSCSGRAS